MNENSALLAIDFNNQKVIETLKKTVAIGATDEEFFMFAEMCKTTGLNPFKKEIWFIKAGGRPQMMTGINGYWTIANRHPMFDGPQYETDNPANPTWVKCSIYRKDRRFPAEGLALMKEYKGRSPIWNEKPYMMLTKVAESIALRKAFPQELNGLYTAEEMPPEYDAQVIPPKREPPIVRPNVTERQAAKEILFNENNCFVYSLPDDMTPSYKRSLFALIKKSGAIFDDKEKVIKSPIPLQGLENNLIEEPVEGKLDDFDADPLPWETEEEEVNL